MDPKLFDILWQVYRESGSQQPIDILSAYRSPQTNAMLRRRSRQVAEHSQHMEGRAVDAHFLDVGTATIRDITMRMQAGGVGFYPTGGTPWVHIDCGSIRYWPRMSRDALTRLFPDGKTVFIPSDGQPMAGYEQARAEIEARGGEIQTASKSSGFGFLGFLFGARGGGADDEEETGANNVVTSGRGFRSGRGGIQVASVAPTAPDVPTSARANLPRGQTGARPAGAGYPGCPRDREGQSAARPGLRPGRPVDAARPGARARRGDARRTGARSAGRRDVRYGSGSGCGSEPGFAARADCGEVHRAAAAAQTDRPDQCRRGDPRYSLAADKAGRRLGRGQAGEPAAVVQERPRRRVAGARQVAARHHAGRRSGALDLERSGARRSVRRPRSRRSVPPSSRGPPP